MRVATLIVGVLVGSAWMPGTVGWTSAQSPARANAPETFSIMANTKAADVAGAAFLKAHVERYTTEKERTPVEDGLKFDGYNGFLTALRKAPEVGYLEIGSQRYAIRWARETDTGSRRIIVLVTDKPVFFVGGASPDAKPRAGFEVALLRLEMDPSGIGKGTMAGAARVKPGGESGVQVEDYAEAPIQLTSVTRSRP